LFAAFFFPKAAPLVPSAVTDNKGGAVKVRESDGRQRVSREAANDFRKRKKQCIFRRERYTEQDTV